MDGVSEKQLRTLVKVYGRGEYKDSPEEMRRTHQQLPFRHFFGLESRQDAHTVFIKALVYLWRFGALFGKCVRK